MPPPPPTRGRRAIALALVGCVLLSLAVWWQRTSQPAPGVFVADSGDDLGALGRRVLFVASGVCQLVAVPKAVATFVHSRPKALLGISLSAAWLVAVVSQLF
jgi:hypothetical protein